MTDVGVLSYEYQQTQDFVRRIDDVLAATDETRVDRQAQLELARLFFALVDLVDPRNARPEDAGAAVTVPVGLARALQEPRAALPTDLRELAQRLRTGGALDADDIQVLESIKGLTEREASIVFRRMVRR